MAVLISSLGKEKLFNEKEFFTIGSSANCDYVLDLGFEFLLAVQYDANDNKCSVISNFPTDKILFKGQPLNSKLSVEKVCKLMVADSDEFIGIKIIENMQHANTVTQIGAKDFTESDMKELYGDDVNAATRIKIEKRKADLEKDRISIAKQISFAVTDLKKRISLNFKASILLNIALFMSALVTSFGIANYLMGLPITQTAQFLNMPTNIKMLGVFTFMTFGVCLILKQGVFLLLQGKMLKELPASLKLAQNFMLGVSAVFMAAFYVINVIYYSNPNGRIVFAILISLFFVALTATLALASGYFKHSGHSLSLELDKYEYREDFENVMSEYQLWIERYINNLSSVKLGYIKDKLFMLQLKGVGETILGILTAPFLAYGVSNTLAMCFPEAAGWIRISGLRFSPVFLVLATMLIVFAFFAFVNAFTCIKKIAGSNVIKMDGFRNYMSHGVDIFGLENVRKLDLEKTRSLVIGLSIIAIEFSMNTSYFMSEIGGDFKGIFLSLVAALVPTALLIAETYMLSQTKYEIFVSDELISKLDRK